MTGCGRLTLAGTWLIYFLTFDSRRNRTEAEPVERGTWQAFSRCSREPSQGRVRTWSAALRSTARIRTCPRPDAPETEEGGWDDFHVRMLLHSPLSHVCLFSPRLRESQPGSQPARPPASQPAFLRGQTEGAWSPRVCCAETVTPRGLLLVSADRQQEIRLPERPRLYGVCLCLRPVW